MNQKSDTIILAENKEKVVPDGTELQVLDRKELVVAIIALGFMPTKVIGEKYKVTFHFIPEEIEEISNKLLSNSPVLIDYHRLVWAEAYWQNTITLWKSRKELIGKNV